MWRDEADLFDWLVGLSSVVLAVLLVYIPFELQAPLGFPSLLPLRVTGIVLGFGGGCILLRRLFPSLPPWIGWVGRAAVVLGALVLLLRVGAPAARWFVVVFATLNLVLVPLGPALGRRGVPVLRLFLTLAAAGIAFAMLVHPVDFPTERYGPLLASPREVAIPLLALGILIAVGTVLPLGWSTTALLCLLSAVLWMALAISTALANQWATAAYLALIAVFSAALIARPRVALPPRLAVRLALMLAVAVAVALLTMGAVASSFAQQALRAQVLSGSRATVEGTAALVRQYVLDRQSAAEATARSPGVQADLVNRDARGLSARLYQTYIEFGFLMLLAVDAEGVLVASYPPREALYGMSLADQEYVQAARAIGQPYLGLSFRTPLLPGEPLTVPYVVPVHDDGTLVGMLVSYIDLSSLATLVSAIRLGETGFLFLVDRDGTVLVHPDPAVVGTSIPEESVAWQALQGRRGVVEGPGADQVLELVAFEYLPDLGWGLIAQVPAREAYRPVTALSALILLIMVLATALISGLAAWIGLRFTRPVQRLAEAAEAFRVGKVQQRVEVRTGDEVENLARAFNEMSAELGAVLDELGRTNAELRAILDAVESGIVLVDTDGRVRYANRELGELFGIVVNGVVGELQERALLPLLRPHVRDPAGFERAWREFTAKTTAVMRREVEIVAPQRRVLRTYAAPVFHDDRLLGRILVFQDVTLERRSRELEEEFLLLVTHEFRQPLTTILGNVGLLIPYARTRGDRWMLDRLEGIRRGVDRLRAMVAELLDVALIGAGRLQEQLTYQRVDLRQLVREALALEERALANHPVRLELPETFPLVRVDRRRILSAIRNLLSNAGRYTPPGTEIVVRLDHYDGWVKLAVTDRGPGLRPEELPRLFNRFWRARVARGGVTYGLGLGLYINREVVRAHGGEMGAESAPGRGSTFWFRLPVATEGAD